MMKIGITGGIGSGKSTVCRLFASKGIAVYDSDRAAKRLMGEPGPLRDALVRRFGPRTFCGDTLDRRYLADLVFSDSAALTDLNALVHPAVMSDFDVWCGRQQGDYIILESAVLFDSGLEAMVDRTVAVLAPAELRVERACRRDGCDPESVRQRIAAQLDDETLSRRADFSLVNLFEEDLQAAVDELDRRFRGEGNTLWS